MHHTGKSNLFPVTEALPHNTYLVNARWSLIEQIPRYYGKSLQSLRLWIVLVNLEFYSWHHY